MADSLWDHKFLQLKGIQALKGFIFISQLCHQGPRGDWSKITECVDGAQPLPVGSPIVSVLHKCVLGHRSKGQHQPSPIELSVWTARLSVGHKKHVSGEFMSSPRVPCIQE